MFIWMSDFYAPDCPEMLVVVNGNFNSFMDLTYEDSLV